MPEFIEFLGRKIETARCNDCNKETISSRYRCSACAQEAADMVSYLS